MTEPIGMREDVNIPELRFKGFDTKLNNVGFTDVGKIMIGLTHTPTYISQGKPFLSSKNISNGFIDFENVQHISEEKFASMPSSTKPKKGDILFTRVGSNLGNPIVLDKDIEFGVFVSLGFFRVNEMAYNLYIQQWMASNYFWRQLEEKVAGGAKNNLNTGWLKEFILNIPSLPEQEKIASFLSAVDQKIELLRRKKEILEEYKKGVMQKLFSQEIRFKRDDGSEFPDWDEKRLDAMISKFVVPMRDKPKELIGEIPWCRIEDFDGKYLRGSKSNQGVSTETVKEMNLKVYPVGTLLVSCSANLGFCAITEVELITNQTFIGLVPDNKKANVLYLLYVMRMLSRKLNTLSSGTTISYLSRQQFEQFKIPYPSLSEQNKIAIYLSRIDEKIDQVTIQITQSQTFKKGLLQKMFV